MKNRRAVGIAELREYMIEGHPITRVEALLLFGVPDLTKVVSDLRAERYIVLRGAISFAAAIVRMRGLADVAPPVGLPVRDILLTEYRVSR